MRRSEIAAVAAGLLVAILIATDAVPGVRGPESWQWQRRPLESAMGLVANLVVFGLGLLVAARVRRAWAAGKSAVRVAWLAAAVILVFAQMVLLTAVEPGGLSNVPRRVLSPSFTSYHTVAGRVRDPVRLLGRYHEIQRSFPVHGPSQPPGRVLFFWTVDRFVEGNPDPWLRLGERLGGVPPGPAGTSDASRAGAVAAGFLLMLAGALAIVPLTVIVGGRCEPDAVGAVMALMACLPGFLVFTPQTDHLILLTSLAAAAFGLEAMRYAAQPRAIALSAAAGLSASAGIFVSFTTLAALGAWGLGAIGMVALAKAGRLPFPALRRSLQLAGVAIVGLLSVPIVTSILGMNWPAVFRQATAAARHVQVFEQGREYSTWVTWNLWDFALFLGVPLAIVVAARIRGEFGALRSGGKGPDGRMLEAPFALALVAAVVVLDLSGTILGETGRIWMFLMPLAVAAVATGMRGRPFSAVLPVAGAQFVVLLALRAFLNVPG